MFRRGNWLTWCATVFTIAYLIFWIFICFKQADRFWSLDFNEIGDFLAGTVGPLVLVWVVVGYFLQGKELQNSVEALNKQSQELENSVRQHAQMVEVAKQTLAHEKSVFESEQDRKTFEKAAKLTLSLNRNLKHSRHPWEDELTISNSGGLARDIEINGYGDLAISKVKIPLLNKGESRTIGNLSSGSVPNQSDSSLHIFYSDENNEEFEMVFVKRMFDQLVLIKHICLNRKV